MVMMVIRVTIVTMVTNVTVVHWLLWLHEGAGRALSCGHFLSSFKEQNFVLEMVNMIGDVCRTKPFWFLDSTVAANEEWDLW